jgi:hypothetical protein
MTLSLAVASCAGSSRSASTTPPSTTAPPTTAPPTTAPATTTSATPPSTTTPRVATTSSPTPSVIERPYVDPELCGPGAKAQHTFHDERWVPFAVAAPQTVSMQVLASPNDGVARPFAVVIRLSTPRDRRGNDHPVTINGAAVSITVRPNGNGEAMWTLPDDTWAYLRSRDLTQAALVELITRLTPRSSTADIPGFDLAPPVSPDDIVLLHERLNNGLSGSGARFQCSTEPNKGIYWVDVLQGDPVVIYFGIIDRPRPYVVGLNGDGALLITGLLTDERLTLDDITNADQAAWDAIRPIGPYGT